LTTLGILGLGKMGRAMLRVLIDRGCSITAWNRTLLAPDNTEFSDARLVATAAEAVARSSHVISVLPNTAITREVLNNVPKENLQGRLLVQFASGRPDEARELQHWAGTQGAQYLMGAVLSYPSNLGHDGSTIVISGDRRSFEQAQSWIALLGYPLYVGSDAGLASAMEQATLVYSYNEIEGFLQGAAVAAKNGLAVNLYFEALQRLGYAREAVEYYGQRIVDREYSDPGATLTTHKAALRGVISSAQALGIDCSTLLAIDRQMDRRIREGFGENDIAALFETF
jgi:3-hydroxyisobutyrate dehydrogenase-like beta-hydroxyacid dehydrogenase